MAISLRTLLGAGVSGYSGKSGFSGYSGTSGTSAYSGISGYSGRSGSKTLKQEQMSMERSYPFIARENAAYRGELPGQEGGKPSVPSVTNVSIPPAAIELLKSEPQKYRESFERKYGVRADVYLGGGR